MSVDWIEIPAHPSLAASEKAAEAALICAKERGIAISIVVVDASGQLICGKRMDAARPVTAELALAKARMAAIHRRATHHFQEMVAPDGPAFGLQHHTAGGAGILPGGLPVAIGIHLHGAVGASGADREGDIVCAQAAQTSLIQNREQS
jgi:glc operon protein GlcG